MPTDEKSVEVSPALVRLGHIDWVDERFLVRSYLRCDELHRSLDRCGILELPLLLAKGGGAFAIVDGFKRLRWLKERGGEEVACRIFPESWGFGRVIIRRVEGKLFGPPLNAAEKARLIALLENDISRERSREYFAALGVSCRPEIVEKWRALAEAGDALLEAVAMGQVSEKAAFDMIGWGEQGECRTAALGLLKELRCSASIQVEILERITEVSIVKGMTRAELLSTPALRKILDDPESNHREKTQAVRAFLARLRFPRLTAREEAFNRGVSQLGMPGAVSLMPPPAFEGTRWQLRIEFSNPQELKDLTAQSLTLLDDSRLETLMFPKDAE